MVSSVVRSHRRTSVVAALLLGGASLGTAISSPPANAAVGGRWTQLSAGNVGLSNAPSVARQGGNLIVAWSQNTADNMNMSLKSRVLGAGALPTGPESTALTWTSISTDPRVFLLGGKPTIAFGGLRSLDSTDPYNGPMSYVQSTDGVAWAQGPGSLTQTRLAYGDYGIGAVDDGTGQPLVALAAASTDHVTVHHGVDPAVPAASPDTTADTTGEAQQVGLARDTTTGAAYALWYSGASGPFIGIHAQQVWPTGGPSQLAPLSQVSYSGSPISLNPSQNVAVTSRIGGGVWAAYGSGYPSAHRLVLWQVGTTRQLTLTRSGGIQYVGVSPAPGGRLWVWWVEGNAVYATRTNATQTAFGVVRKVVAPGGYSATRTSGDGTLGPLDLVINGAANGTTSGIYSTRLLAGLRVTTKPARLRAATGGKVVVSVTDAGMPVRGAVVHLGSTTRRTDARGHATLTFAAGRTGVRKVTATHTGYVRGAAKVRLR